METNKMTPRGGEWKSETMGDETVCIFSDKIDYDGKFRSVVIMSSSNHEQALQNKVNADHIVNCVNSHNELVENLGRLLDRIMENGWAALIPSAFERAKQLHDRLAITHEQSEQANTLKQ